MNVNKLYSEKTVVKTNGLEIPMKDFTDLIPSIRALACITRKVYLEEDLTMQQLIALNELCDYGVVLHHKDILANVEDARDQMAELEELYKETEGIKRKE